MCFKSEKKLHLDCRKTQAKTRTDVKNVLSNNFAASAIAQFQPVVFFSQ